MGSILGLRIFTLDVAGTPILTFEAKNLREAQEVCREKWLLDDLLRLSSNGIALSDAQAKLRVRYAAETEADIYRNGAAIAQEADDDLILVYLIELDGTGKPDTSRPPAPEGRTP